MKRFENQVAIISGGADGLGKGIAGRIASEGGTVAVFDINEKLLQQAVSEFRKRGFTVESYFVDISSESAVQKAIHEVEKKFGKIDIMVNSAGIVGPTSTKITDYTVEDYDRIYAINLRGSFLMTKYAATAMEKNNYGRILLIASIAGKEGNPFMAGYSSMKAGVIGLVKGIGKEYAETGPCRHQDGDERKHRAGAIGLHDCQDTYEAPGDRGGSSFHFCVDRIEGIKFYNRVYI